MANETHIVPVHVGDPGICKLVSDLLLSKHGIYIQPINYPTVSKGSERLRITPSPHHTDELMDYLTASLATVWDQLKLPRTFS
jgi:5-aminolevulinate synthase